MEPGGGTADVPAAPEPERRLPDPRGADIAVWTAFLRANAVLMRRLAGEIESTGLPFAWYDVLVQLVQAEGRRLRMAQLADNVMLSRSGLTRLIDRLENDGLVRREPDPGDARGTFTVLTPRGLDRLRTATPIHLAGIQRLFLDKFDPEELRSLGVLMGRLVPRG